jgi:hypothetical protein
MKLFGVPYKDLGDSAEDERIRQIGEKAMREKLIVGFIVDSDGETGFEKAERYIAKLTERFPGIRVTYRGDGPVADTKLVKVAPPLN